MDNTEFSKPIDLKDIEITDKFWGREQELVRKEVIPYQWNALNDRIEGAEKSYCMHNFKVAGKLKEERKLHGKDYKKVDPLPTFWGAKPEDEKNLGDKFYGFVFQDSDFSKWVEAVAYSLTNHPDKDLEKTADEAIDIVCEAQHESGYLDTYYLINDFDKAFTNLRDAHELYCFGHLTEGAVAYYLATGKDKLLNAAKKYADYIISRIGKEPGKIHGYPGHEIAEMALVRLYEVTKEEKYLDLATYFINERGQKPYFFDIESNTKSEPHMLKYTYNQAHLPVREQTEAVGHAVRAGYLYSGMADIARLKEDESLFKACENLWDSITKRKMYVTGGIGATHIGEAFSFDYDLPNDTAYSETCAAISLVFFARRMLEIKPDSKYADIMERALYNGVLSGMALDGKSFFYVNPLEVFPKASELDERKAHVKSKRQKWFGCACCPPNIARLVSSIPEYAFTQNEDTLFVHLYLGSIVKKKYKEGEVTFDIESNFPWNFDVKIKASCKGSVSGKLALRLPGWCKTLPKIKDAVEKDGYLYVERNWEDKDEISLSFPANPKFVSSNPYVRENAGKVCVLRGPLVYCLEEEDNGDNLQNLYADVTSSFEQFDFKILDMGLKGLSCNGIRINESDRELYKDYETPNTEAVTLKFVPYFSWNNRGDGEMSVWVKKDRL